MYEEVEVLSHSSIKISGSLVLYFDPFNIADETHDADIILITHEHYDHYSPEDIGKIIKGGTILVCPESIKEKIKESPCGVAAQNIRYLSPDEDIELDSVKIHAVRAYNVDKNFHKKSYDWLGYVVSMDGTIYYVAGDTDINEDILSVRSCHPDVALIPCGGTFTMDVREAASLAEKLSPKIAIPTHYGSIVGDKKDGDEFVRLLKGKVPAETRIKFS